MACHCALLLQASMAADVMVPTAPSGFAALPGAPGSITGTAPAGGLEKSILDGFALATTLSGTYDSNVTQSPGLPVAPVVDDFILSLGGNVSYLSKAPDWTFGGNYRGSYNEYFSNSEFSGYTQGGSLLVNYDGGRFSATFNGGIDLNRGSNRNYSSAFVTQTSYNAGLTARYRLSPKTSLLGNMSQSFSTASGGISVIPNPLHLGQRHSGNTRRLPSLARASDTPIFRAAPKPAARRSVRP